MIYNIDTVKKPTCEQGREREGGREGEGEEREREGGEERSLGRLYTL